MLTKNRAWKPQPLSTLKSYSQTNMNNFNSLLDLRDSLNDKYRGEDQIESIPERPAKLNLEINNVKVGSNGTDLKRQGQFDGGHGYAPKYADYKVYWEAWCDSYRSYLLYGTPF